MHATVGILFAFGALISWGLGDFFIQRSSRHVGRTKTLFFLALFGAIVLFPFAAPQLPALLHMPRIVLQLVVLSLFILPVALVNFEALKRGKISVVMPVIGLELPITVLLALYLSHERLSAVQLMLIGVVFIGVVLTVTAIHGDEHSEKMHVERGAILALFAAIGLAVINYTIAITSQQTSEVLTLWFTHTMLAVISGVYLLVKGRFVSAFRDVRRFPVAIIGASFFDNAGWLSYAHAATRIPISIAVTITEGFVALASILGIVVNKEKLRPHQFVGAAIAICGILVLAYIT